MGPRGLPTSIRMSSLERQTTVNHLLDGFTTKLTITEISTEPIDDTLLDPDVFCWTDQ